MPRYYDLGARLNEEQRQEHGMFMPLDLQRTGAGELSFEDRFRDSGNGRMQHPQFRYEPGGGIPYYSKESLDPVFTWLGENTTGNWYWDEVPVNDDQALVFEVWLELPEDIQAFRESWPDHFKVIHPAMEHNAKLAIMDEPSPMAMQGP